MLNVLTPKGRKFEEDTRIILTEVSEKLKIGFCFFPITSHSFVDGFVHKDNTLLSVFEAKYRNASYDENKIKFRGKHYDEYLITATKIDDGVEIAKKVMLDYHIFVILTESKHMLSFKIYDAKKDKVIDHKREKTKTQFGANGGVANRINAFIKVNLAKIIKL